VSAKTRFFLLLGTVVVLIFAALPFLCRGLVSLKQPVVPPPIPHGPVGGAPLVQPTATSHLFGSPPSNTLPAPTVLPTAVTLMPTKEPGITILALGLDDCSDWQSPYCENRGPLGEKYLYPGSNTPKERSRADVIALIRLTNSKVTVLRVPRDLLVRHKNMLVKNSSGQYEWAEGKDRLNAGYYYTGVTGMKEALKDNFDIEVDYVAVVTFNAISAGFDCLGGLEIDGVVYNGKELVEKARLRRGIGDIARIGNQNALLSLALDKFKNELGFAKKAGVLLCVWSNADSYYVTDLPWTTASQLILRYTDHAQEVPVVWSVFPCVYGPAYQGKSVLYYGSGWETAVETFR